MSPDEILQLNIESARRRWESECTNYWHEKKFGFSDTLAELADKNATQWMNIYYQLVTVRAMWQHEKTKETTRTREVGGITWDDNAEDGGEPL